MTHASHLLSGSSFLAMNVGSGLTLAEPSELKDKKTGSLVRAASSLTLAPEAKAIRKTVLLRINLGDWSD